MDYLHVASNSWVSVDPPGTPNTGLPVEYSELICSQGLFETASHGHSGLSSTYYEDRVVGVRIFAVDVALMNSGDGRRHVAGEHQLQAIE